MLLELTDPLPPPFPLPTPAREPTCVYGVPGLGSRTGWVRAPKSKDLCSYVMGTMVITRHRAIEQLNRKSAAGGAGRGQVGVHTTRVECPASIAFAPCLLVCSSFLL